MPGAGSATAGDLAAPAAPSFAHLRELEKYHTFGVPESQGQNRESPEKHDVSSVCTKIRETSKRRRGMVDV
jgi:hypothetical protein